VKPLTARLRAMGLHARYSSKTTRNIGKLLKDASDSLARRAIIVEGKDAASVKDLGTGQQIGPMPLEAALAIATQR
jgi:histidyl-tRNA synthetase